MRLSVINITKGLVLYDGPSLLDNKNILCLATGFQGSSNIKTGNMVQLYILVKDVAPIIAVKTGEDTSICGDCKHRSWKTCYVNVAQGPNMVYKTWAAGKYKVANDSDYSMFNNRLVRLGAYGDPAAVPINIISEVCNRASGHTGYTHQWNNSKTDQRLKLYCMASVDSPAELYLARSKGWRTFRAKRHDDPILDKEFACPASDEANNRLQCEDCLACDGGVFNGKGTVVINVHGVPYKLSRFSNNTAQLNNSQTANS
jgi:hypothetical protein